MRRDGAYGGVSMETTTDYGYHTTEYLENKLCRLVDEIYDSSREGKWWLTPSLEKTYLEIKSELKRRSMLSIDGHK